MPQVKPGDGMPRMVGQREQRQHQLDRGRVGQRIAPLLAGFDLELA